MKVLSCRIRKKSVQSTPEELVRQNLLGCLLGEFGCPAALVSVEISLASLTPFIPKSIGNRRVDIVCFVKRHDELIPLLLIECKSRRPAMSTISQICGYNLHIRCPIFAIAWPDLIAIYRHGLIVYVGEQALMPSYEALQNLLYTQSSAKNCVR